MEPTPLGGWRVARAGGSSESLAREHLEMDARLYFGKIHIIEWLGPGDLKTGWALFDELQPAGLVSAPPIDVGFCRVQSRAEFVAAIRATAEDFQSSGKLPLLHVETHGSSEGVGSADYEGLTWSELMLELIPLNQLTGLRLWVVLAACEGIWGLKMAQPATRAAFLALLGPNQPISAGKLQDALLQFYRTILREKNGNAAILAMNEAVSPEPATFSIVNAEMLFKEVYAAYVRDRCSDSELARRVDDMSRAAARQFFAEHRAEMPRESEQQFRALARQYLEAIDERFAETKRHFFFTDLFPENEERFPITLDECRNAV